MTLNNQYHHKFMAILIFLLIPIQAYAIKLKASYTEWLRLPLDLSQLTANPSGKLVAFSNKFHDLYVLDTVSKKIFLVEKALTNPSPVWSPDGTRLFYRAIKRVSRDNITTQIKVFERDKQKAKLLISKKGLTGFLSFNPYTQDLLIPTTSGVSKYKIHLPTIKAPRWQKEMSKAPGSWIISYKGILWLPPNSAQSLVSVYTGSGPIQNYAISYKGDYIAFSEGGKIYFSKEGSKPQFIDYGDDPSWNPKQDLLVFSRHAMSGGRILAKELALWSPASKLQKTLTQNPQILKRNPVWLAKSNQIIFTAERSTDLFLLSLLE